MTGVQRTIAACLGIVAVVIGLFVYSVMRTPTLSDAQLKEMGVFILPTPREISEFALTSHRGEPFTLEDLEGRWTFAFFGFTNCPDICPTSMSVLGQAQTRLSESDAGRGVLVDTALGALAATKRCRGRRARCHTDPR